MNAPAPLRLEAGDDSWSNPEVGTAFGCSRDFLGNRFVYTVVSPRMGGLSIGVNMNPDKFCNFDCVYCEVDRRDQPLAAGLDVPVMEMELQQTLELVQSGRIRDRANYRSIPVELIKPGHVALSGDGEPTLCPHFSETVEAVIHLRAKGDLPFFKLVLITNGSRLNRPEIAEVLHLFTPSDEIWVKLDAGSQEHMSQINRSGCLLEDILANILNLARRRPVIIQSLFPAVNGVEPTPSQIENYVQRLGELTEAGAQIPLVQIYSATRPTPNAEAGHLPLEMLSKIARRVREVTGLRADVF